MAEFQFAGLTIGSAQDTLAIQDADGLTVNAVIIPDGLEVSFYDVPGDAVDAAFFVANRAYQVVGVRYMHSTAAGAAANVQLERLQATEAPGAGDDLLTNNTNAGFDSNATADTVQAGTLVATTAVELAAGDRLGIVYTGTHTSTAGVALTVTLQAI